MGEEAAYNAFEIVTGDAIEVCKTLDDASLQLVISSPPYNIGKPYEKKGFPSLSEYSDWMHQLLVVVDKKLAVGGSVCWQVGNYVEDGSVVPLDTVFYPIFRDLGFKLRNRIVWTFNFGLHAKQRLSGRYETLLWFTKGDPYKFNLDAVRVPQLYPGKRHASGSGKEGPSGNPLGKNPSDFWEFDGNRYFQDDAIWRVPNLKANHPEKEDHPCQFPSELVSRCVLAFSDVGDLVMDPFSGTGTTPIVASALGRRGLGIEIDPNYAEASRNRKAFLEGGEKRLRAANAPVRQPNPDERVSQTPAEWLQAAE